MNAWRLFGWGPEQWAKAIDYYRLCNDGPCVSMDEVHRVCLLTGAGVPCDFKPLMDVMYFWRNRRIDEPCEITIEVFS
jgi:hypothetical protein